MITATGRAVLSPAPQRRRMQCLALLALLLISSLLVLVSTPAIAVGAERALQGGSCPPTQPPTPFGPSGTISNPRPTFSWSAVPGAETYTLYVFRVSDGTTVLRQTGITASSFTPASALPSGVQLRWKVKGECAGGTKAGPYSPDTFFTIQAPTPPAVTIVAPAQGSTVAGTVNVQTNVSSSVTRVEFYVDGVLQSTDIIAPYAFTWNTAANPLPAPNHAMDLGYYFVEYKNPANFDMWRAEVNGYTNLYYASLSSYETDLTTQEKLSQLNRSLSNAVAEGRRIHLALDLNYPPHAPLLDAILDTARPYWGQIVRIELADEATESRAQVEGWIATVNNKLSARGLTPPAQGHGITYLYDRPLPDSRNATGLSWVGIEAYLDFPGSPISQVNIDNLNTQVRNAMAQVPSGKQIVIVMMAYARNGAWTNIDTLRDLQVPTYLLAYNDPRVISINMFAYARPSGTREHPELKTPHRLIAERVLNRSIAAAGNGPRTLVVKAFDAAGNSATSRVTVTVAN